MYITGDWENEMSKVMIRDASIKFSVVRRADMSLVGQYKSIEDAYKALSHEWDKDEKQVFILIDHERDRWIQQFFK